MDYRKDIINLYNSDEYQRLKAYYSKRSTLDILGVARSELAHSNMLAWLLDPEETHGLGLFPIRKFLHLLVMAKLELSINRGDGDGERAYFDKNLLDSILTNSCMVESARVEAEKPVDSTGDKHKDSRLDIYLEVRLRMSKNEKVSKVLPIVIENKVDSKEHDNQTENYYKWVMEHIKSDENTFINPLCVFLTPQKTLALNGDTYYGKVSCSCEYYIKINYQYIVDHLVEQCLKQDLSEDVRRVLKDYLRSLTYTYIKGDINEGGSYMAIGGEEQGLLKAFWDNNQNLLSAVLRAYADGPESSDEESDSIHRFLDSRAKKDFTKYLIEGVHEGPFPKGRMVWEVVKKYCDDHKDVGFEELKKTFNRPEIKCGFGGVVVRLEEKHEDSKGRKRYFDETISLSDGTEVCVCSNWGSGNIEPFIRLAEGELNFKIHKAS